MSFLSAASMTGSPSSTGNEQPSDTTIGMPKSVQVAPSKEKRSVPREVSLLQDTRNHPFLFAAAVIAVEVIIVIAFVFYNWIIRDGDGNVNNDFLSSPPAEILLTSLIACIILWVSSLLPASWSSRWRSESKKEEELVIPSFSVRLWHSFRFMLPPFLISAIVKSIIHYFTADIITDAYLTLGGLFGIPLILSLLGYLGIVAYDYFHTKGKSKEKKELAPAS